MSSPRPHLDELAELDAGLLDTGLLDAERAQALRDDPASRAVLEALAATRADLAAMAAPPVPAAVAARWAAALRVEQGRPDHAGEASRPMPAGSATGAAPREAGPTGAGPADAQPIGARSADTVRRPAGRRGPAGPRPGMRTWRRPAAVAAALLVVLAAATALHRAGPSADDAQPALVAQARRSIGVRDAGALTDGSRRAACLRAVAPAGITPTAPLVGGRQVVFAGHPGVLLVLGTGRRGVLAVVVVDPGCTALLAVDRIGG